MNQATETRTALAVASSASLVRADEGPQARLERIKAEKQLVRHAMRDVMKEGVHYGTIPGTPKPSLWDAGATTVLSLFHIAVDPEVEDLSTTDEIRYRVRQVASLQGGGALLGSAYGEASTKEEKYKWRRAVCRQEFEATPEDRRRVKWAKGRDGVYSTEQIRTEPADLANTVLKMAVKRARIAVTLQVTGASDVFAQDLEDLPEEFVASAIVEDDVPAVTMPSRKSAAPPAATAPAPVVKAEPVSAAPAPAREDEGDVIDAEVPEKDGSVYVIKSASLGAKGESKRGPWQVFNVFTLDGKKFGTFSETIYQKALSLVGKAARITANEPNAKGNVEIVSLEAVGE